MISASLTQIGREEAARSGGTGLPRACQFGLEACLQRPPLRHWEMEADRKPNAAEKRAKQETLRRMHTPVLGLARNAVAAPALGGGSAGDSTRAIAPAAVAPAAPTAVLLLAPPAQVAPCTPTAAVNATSHPDTDHADHAPSAGATAAAEDEPDGQLTARGAPQAPPLLADDPLVRGDVAHAGGLPRSPAQWAARAHRHARHEIASKQCWTSSGGCAADEAEDLAWRIATAAVDPDPELDLAGGDDTGGADDDEEAQAEAAGRSGAASSFPELHLAGWEASTRVYCIR